MMVGELLTMSTSFFEDELIGITAVVPVFLKSFVVVFFSHRQNVARKLNAKLEEWLSKVHPTCRPAKAIIAP